MCWLIYVGCCWVRLVMNSGRVGLFVGSMFKFCGRWVVVFLCSSVICLWKWLLWLLKLWLNSGYFIG